MSYEVPSLDKMTPPAGNVSMAGHKLTSLANGTSAADSAAAGQLAATWGPAQQGYLTWNYDGPASINGSNVPLTTAGNLYVMSAYLPIAAPVTNIVTYLSAPGTALSTGQCFAALFQGTLSAVLGTTGDQSSTWNTGGLKVMPISGGPVTAAAGPVIASMWFNGTTGPSPWRTNSTAGLMNAGLTTATSRWGVANTGLTTAAPGTLGAITASAPAAWWFALS